MTILKDRKLPSRELKPEPTIFEIVVTQLDNSVPYPLLKLRTTYESLPSTPSAPPLHTGTVTGCKYKSILIGRNDFSCNPNLSRSGRPKLITTKAGLIRGVCEVTLCQTFTTFGLPRLQSICVSLHRLLTQNSINGIVSNSLPPSHTLPLTDCGKIWQVVEHSPVSFCASQESICTRSKIRSFVPSKSG
jgi:hypothetical protein